MWSKHLVAIVLLVLAGQALAVNSKRPDERTPQNGRSEQFQVCERASVADHRPAGLFAERGRALRPRWQKAQPRIGQSAPTYSFADLNQLNHADLVDLLTTIHWYDIPELFQFNEDSQAFYSDTTRVEALIAALEEYGAVYTSDSGGLAVETLVEVLRSGFFLGFYYPELAHINTWEYKSKCWPALNTIADNPNFGLGTENQDMVAASYGALIGSGTATVDLVNKAAPLFQAFNDNAGDYLRQWWKTNALWWVGQGIDYALVSSYLWANPDAIASPFYDALQPLYHELGRLALYGILHDDYAWVIDNGVWWAGRLGQFVPGTLPNRILTDVIATYGKWPTPSVQAAQLIVEYHGGVDADGAPVDLEEVRNELLAQLLPHTYRFDDGAVIFKTGALVTREKVNRLYWAMKEVKTQFHRLLGSDLPLSAGQPDDSLTAIIYSTPSDYTYNRFLYNLGTNNGGIYIESWGTFFTYERTPAESIYTLEDLFRHEYVHYLQGRFEVPGLWGQHEIYAGERLTWFEEGQAEFIAGSSRTNGIETRRTIVANLAANAQDRMSLADVFQAKYSSGFTFYNYSAVVHNFLYEQHPDVLFTFIDRVKQGNTAAFDALADSLSTALNDAYFTFMENLKQQQFSFNDPVTSDDYLAEIYFHDTTAVYDEIVTTAGLADVSVNILRSPDHDLFQLSGSHIGPAATFREQDWLQMDQTANAFLTELSQLPWNGFQTLTCTFTDYQIDSLGRAQFQVQFNGILPGTSFPTSARNDSPALPAQFTMSQNYPNPFNPATTIQYALAGQADVTLEVYNIMGQRVTTLVSEKQEAGPHSVRWSGRLENGRAAASGIYFFKLRAASREGTFETLQRGTLQK